MRKTLLLDVLFASEKRRSVLLLLQDESKEMDFFLKSLDMTRQSLLPQIKVLEEHHLISHHKDTYGKYNCMGKRSFQLLSKGFYTNKRDIINYILIIFYKYN